jgi:hypothetical protein
VISVPPVVRVKRTLDDGRSAWTWVIVLGLDVAIAIPIFVFMLALAELAYRFA